MGPDEPHLLILVPVSARPLESGLDFSDLLPTEQSKRDGMPRL